MWVLAWLCTPPLPMILTMIDDSSDQHLTPLTFSRALGLPGQKRPWLKARPYKRRRAPICQEAPLVILYCKEIYWGNGKVQYDEVIPLILNTTRYFSAVVLLLSHPSQSRRRRFIMTWLSWTRSLITWQEHGKSKIIGGSSLIIKLFSL